MYGPNGRNAPTSHPAISALDKIEVKTGQSVQELRAESGRVIGVTLKDGSKLDADLVVDASGRGTTVERSLSANNLGEVSSSEVGIDLSYVTRRYRFPEVDWKVLVIFPEPPEARGAVAMKLEDGSYF